MQILNNLLLPEKFCKHERHITVSGYIFNKSLTKVVLLHHKKLHKWMAAGGHIEVNELPHEAISREIKEEVGVEADFIDSMIAAKFDSVNEWKMPSPYFAMMQVIPETKTNPEHLHYDYSYILVARTKKLNPKPDESQKVQWFSLPEVLKLETFPIVPKICKAILSKK